jgi:hypothetical protein
MANLRWSSWRHILGEAALIVASVYLAIFLQGWSDDRERVQSARTGLIQVRSDLIADRADLAKILEEQREHSASYKRLLRWLATPDAMPNDSVDATLRRLSTSNRTMFPRRGAWTSLVSTGLLSSIGDERLVSRLGGFYETVNERLEYNGRDYDFNLNEVSRVTVAAAWDSGRRRPIENVTLLRNQLDYLQHGWTQWYLDLLGEYERELSGLLQDLNAYLGLPERGT